ncbi:MAG: SGNH/GDSL hydrolase family protein [Cyanobacteria bacterium P01_G01_bin.54]
MSQRLNWPTLGSLGVRSLRLGGLLLGSLLLLELALRGFTGLGNPVLLQVDTEIGYRFVPNQRKHRFGRHLHYNRYSQRSEPLAIPPPARRILMTGDSVLNGGNLIDQSETIAEQLEQWLNGNAANARLTTEVLNASAGSWGIGNQWAYLQKFGSFESDLLILQIGTHDLIQPTSTGEKIGQDPSFPDRPPRLALQEVWSRYLWPQGLIQQPLRWRQQPASAQPSPQPQLSAEQIEAALQARFEQNLAYLSELLAWAEAEDLPVWVVYTPDRVDVLPPEDFPPDFQPFLKAAFMDWLRSHQVPLIDTHTAWQALPPEVSATYFRDHVHLTPEGNQAVAAEIVSVMIEAEFLPDE